MSSELEKLLSESKRLRELPIKFQSHITDMQHAASKDEILQIAIKALQKILIPEKDVGLGCYHEFYAEKAITEIELIAKKLNAVHEPIKEIKTKKDFVWEKIKNGVWKDKTTNLIWGPIHRKKLDHYQAVKEYGDSLPTKEEFEEAENHGIREVLDMKDYWFWSSSVNPYYTDNAYDFYGNSGYIYYAVRSNYNVAAVCVSGR